MKKRGIGYFNTWLGCNMKWVALALVVIMGLLPLMVSSSYVIRIATLMLMYIMIASSLNLLTGFMGVMSLGHAAFWGIGAYTGAILSTRLGWGMGSCMLAAIVICGLFGLLLGSPVMKLKGYFMTIVTLGFCEIIRLIELNWSDLTRGSLGINNIPYPNFFGIVFKTPASKFYVILVLAIVTLYIVHAITDSRVGRAIISIREDDLAAASVGVNVVKYKLMSFVISAMIAGVAGVYYAHYMRYIDASLFTTSMSINFLVMAIFGGLGNIPGTVIGTAILTVMPESMRFLSEYRNLFYGIVIVLLMMIRPSGIWGDTNFKYLKQKAYQRRKEGK